VSWVIARITLRQLLSRRRTLLLLLLGGVLVLAAGIFRLAGEESRALHFTSGLLASLGIGTLMPLVALIFGTGAIGAEIEDGTAIFLLAKPISRATVVLTKLAVAAVCSAALTCGPMLLAGLIAAGGLGEGLVPGMVAGAAVGSLLVYEHSLVRPGDLRRLDAAFFTMNGVISVAFAAFVIGDALT